MINPKHLIGVAVTEENYFIGALVERNEKERWTHGTQGEEILGKIEGFVNGKELYNVQYNYVSVRWSDNSFYSYPINGCLSFSSGKLKKSVVGEFLETYEVHDIFKIVKISEQHVGDGYFNAGDTVQLTGSRRKTLYFKKYLEGGGTYDMEINVGNFGFLKLRKIGGTKNKMLKEMEELSARFVTPTRTKESIFEDFKGAIRNPNQFFYYKNVYKNRDENVYLSNLQDALGIYGENSIHIKTQFGDITVLSRIQGFYYRINDTPLREFIGNNVESQRSLMYSDWVKVFERLSEKTNFNQKLSNVIKASNCSENLKKFFIGGKKMDETFVDYNLVSKKIVFTPKGKPVKIGGDGKHCGVRQEMSPHKFFGKFFKDSGEPEYDIKCFSDEVIASYGEYRMTEIEDGKIGEFYCSLTQTGWEVGSCMRNRPMSYFQLYDDNPHIFKMMAIMLDGELVGRALKVNAKIEKDGSDFVYIDRLYYKNGEVVAWFEAYCKANGLTRKYKNSAESYKTFYNQEKGSFDANVYIDVTNHLGKQLYEVYKHVPYLDTLGFASDGFLYSTDKFPVKNNPLYGLKRPQHSMRVQNGEYSGKEYSGYCFVNETWTADKVVLINDESSSFYGKTVKKQIVKETEKGYTV